MGIRHRDCDVLFIGLVKIDFLHCQVPIYLISVDVLRLDLTMRVVIVDHCSMLETMSSLCHLLQNFVYIRIHNHDGT